MRAGSLLTRYRAHPSLMLVGIYAAYWLAVSRTLRPVRRDA
jgi:hypothetical protein